MAKRQKELWVFEFIGERRGRERKKDRVRVRVYYWVITLISNGLYLASNILRQICLS